MAKGHADGDVALHCHAGQVRRGVFTGGNSKHDEDTTDGDIYFVDYVADDKQEDGQRHLDHVVEHQVNEKDVAWIHVEYLGGKHTGEK